MKILNFNKINYLVFFYFSLIVMTSYSSYSAPISQLNELKQIKKNQEELLDSLETRIQKKLNIRKIKKNFKMKLNGKNYTSNNPDITEKQLQFLEKISKDQNSNESFIYASWFIFVPLVLLIFIMTILSIAGFLILILNSTNSNSILDKKTHLRNQISRLTRNNLSNQEILDILRLKHSMKEKKNCHSSYRPEPEPECLVLGI